MSLYTTLTHQIKGNHWVIYHIAYCPDLDIALWLGRYHDIALTTTAFDTEAATKHQFPLIIYVELLKVSQSQPMAGFGAFLTYVFILFTTGRRKELIEDF